MTIVESSGTTSVTPSGIVYSSSRIAWTVLLIRRYSPFSCLRKTATLPPSSP